MEMACVDRAVSRKACRRLLGGSILPYSGVYPCRYGGGRGLTKSKLSFLSG